MDSSYSLSDIRAATDHDGCGYGDGFGGGGILAWFLIFALMGGNGFGWGNRGGNPVTEADLCASQNFNNLQNAVGRLSDNQAAIARQTDNAICQIGYQNLQNTNTLESQIAACCCETQNAIGQVRYDMAVQNGDLKALIHSEGEATRNLIQQNKIETLQQQVSQLQLAQALCGIPRTNPYGYGIYAYPACAGMAGCGCTNI